MLRIFIALWLALTPAFAWAGSMSLLGVGKPPTVTSGCSQATTFLARASGLSGTETSAYTTMICGMVTDGTYSLLDALYIFATNNTTTAALNLVSTSFTIAPSGTLTFTADVGWAGDGSTGFLDTGYTPSTAGLNYALNAASVGIYTQTSRTTGTGTSLGTQNNGGSATQVRVDALNGSSFVFDINNFDANSTGNANARGAWVVSRTSSSLYSLYKNGSVTALSTQTSTPVALPNLSIYIEALDVPGSTKINFCSDQQSAAFIGGPLTSAQASSIMNRINAYMAAMTTPVNVY